MTNRAVAAAWVNNPNGEYCNTTKSLFSRGGTIYSYGRHYPLAWRVWPLGEARTGEPSAVAVNNWDYSSTTSRHRSYVVNAAKAAGYQVLWVDLRRGIVAESRMREGK